MAVGMNVHLILQHSFSLTMFSLSRSTGVLTLGSVITYGIVYDLEGCTASTKGKRTRCNNYLP